MGEIGRIARTYAPFRLKSFSSIDVEEYELLVMHLKLKFEWDQMCTIANGCINQAFTTTYNKWKSSLAIQFLKHSNKEDALQDLNEDIDMTDWKWWIEYVHSPEYKVTEYSYTSFFCLFPLSSKCDCTLCIQELSSRNAANSSKQPYTHRGGSKPFVFHQEALSKTAGSNVGFLALFYNTHYSTLKGWINATAERQYLEMKKLVEESADSSNPLTKEEARARVLGSRSGYVKGMGQSYVKDKNASKLHVAQASKIESLEAKIMDQEEKMAKLFQIVEVLQSDRDLNSPGLAHSLHGSHSPSHD